MTAVRAEFFRQITAESAALEDSLGPCWLQPASQRFQITKTRQKILKKICEIDWSNLCLQQFGKFSNMQRMQSPETEIMHKSAGIDLEKNREITSGNLFFFGF